MILANLGESVLRAVNTKRTAEILALRCVLQRDEDGERTRRRESRLLKWNEPLKFQWRAHSLIPT